VGIEGTQDWLQAIGQSCGIAQDKIDLSRNQSLAAMRGILSSKPIQGRITLSGYEGSELLVGRLLVECGADLRYVGSACPATPWNKADADWLKAKGVQVQFRASLEQDMAAVHEYKPQLAIGTTPVVQKAKETGVPSLYFTNLISARPLMGPAGAGSLGQVVNAAIAGKDRLDDMKAFFEGVGHGDTAGIWEGAPNLQPEFRAMHQKKLDKMARAAKAEEMI
jgi:chlorophyllide a reductase subunit Y